LQRKTKLIRTNEQWRDIIRTIFVALSTDDYEEYNDDDDGDREEHGQCHG